MLTGNVCDLQGTAVLFVEMTPPPGAEDEFNRWYDEHRAPATVRSAGFRSAMRYKSEAGPHYLAIYELDGNRSLATDAYRDRDRTSDEMTERMLGSVRGFTRYAARQAFACARQESALAPLDADVIFCAFYTVPQEREGEFAAWFDREHSPILLSDPDWLMTRRLEIVDFDPERYTHLILHYLADHKALSGETVARARGTDWSRKLAAERWHRPHSVVYHRRGQRFARAAQDRYDPRQSRTREGHR